ncbi:hypothetical protein ACA910_014677 [Epithemia clementina (nom. ined.)]
MSQNNQNVNNSHRNIPYEERSVQAKSGWQTRSDGIVHEAKGPCPGCNALIQGSSVSASLVALSSLGGGEKAALGAGKDSRKEQRYQLGVVCNCQHSHPNTPVDTRIYL